ncbi:MAG: carbohydrate-binding domain-containing protein [Lachnospiraceae bacterium]|nr:carbohydrate-binding domain-containing protein [Lachnospiraceae bacterium]
MKRFLKKGMVITCAFAIVMSGCGKQDGQGQPEKESIVATENTEGAAKGSKVFADTTVISLSDDMITVDGSEISIDENSAVYAANDIVFYLERQDFTYGEGEDADEHSQAEADAHTVVHITEPGTYEVSGTLSAGQIAVDLGEDAEENPEAVVTLILNGVDIQCEVAPAIIFYHVYECGVADAENATNTVDTTDAGANVLIVDGSVNNVTGSYVARIYKPDTVELNEDGTEVADAKKLHKYDAAFYSKMSMNVNGDKEGTGVLNIYAENEGLDSELHLTINGGIINITSGNDGINTNEDGVSVTTVNGGNLSIKVMGTTGEGDGIDSNGWLVINGGTVLAQACAFSADAGIDSDMGIHINGGTVIATGNMLDRISESEQNYAVFQFASSQKEANYTLKNEAGEVVIACTPENAFTYLIFSSADMTTGTYTMWMGDTQLAGSASKSQGGFGGAVMPGNFGGEKPEGMEKPEGGFNGEPPADMERPEGGRGGFGGRGGATSAEASIEFVMEDGGNYFNNVTVME